MNQSMYKRQSLQKPHEYSGPAGWWSQASLTQPILLHQENELNSVTLDTMFLNERTK